MADKYTALWVSHSSLTDFLNCPRSYFLKNIYRTPQTNRKIQLVTPALSLGSAIHEIIDSLSNLALDQRFTEPLPHQFTRLWQKYHGPAGGFFDPATEQHYYQRGLEIITRLVQHPGPLEKLAVKIKADLPSCWLSEKDQIILCGKIDWLEFQPDQQTVRVIDFKTSRREESPESLQLPIYFLLASHCQSYPVSGIAYWYLRQNTIPTPKTLPHPNQAKNHILTLAKKVKLARQLAHLTCPDHGCRHCLPFEKILHGKAQFIGLNSFGQECYALPPTSESKIKEIIL
jgi:hypothetical protein